MKIDGGRPNAEASGTQRVDQAGVDRATRTGRKSDTATDSVALSSDAQLATSAAAAAQAAPDIRHDKVEAARKALEAGRVGQDPQALADKMIDSLLGR
jgi:flagellar biosynthesis anti-sigma factor FlgM